MLGESKTFGGARNTKGVHLVEDIRVSRNMRAISVEDYFKQRKTFNLHASIPETAKVAPKDTLDKIRKQSKKDDDADAAASKEVAQTTSTTDFKEEATAEVSDYETDEYSSE